MTAPPRSHPVRIGNASDFARVFSVSRETTDRLALYEVLLGQWQKAVNLVASDTLGDIWHRHFADSAQLLALAPGARRWLDMGAGAGFPGLVIAILLANRDARVHLVESNARKCAFLAEASRKTGAPVEIHQTRIESLAPESTFAGIEIVTARALAPLDALLKLASPLLVPGVAGLFLKGKRAGEEIAAARCHWDFEARCHASLTDPGGQIVEITGLKRGGGNDTGSTDE